ncbi:MAG TPA: hypothetical protein VJ596_06390 [Gemmatimonadaceae bacterium]|nr:hypothetical protein [Gemmatimonadaceae bacterium]
MTEQFEHSFHPVRSVANRKQSLAMVAVVTIAAVLAGCSVVQGGGGAQSGPDPVELVQVDYNSYTDTTKVRTVLLPVVADLEMYAGFRFLGQSIRESPKEVYLVFQETSPTPRWHNPVGRGLELVLNDSTRVRYDETHYLSDTLSGDSRITLKVVEWVWVTVPAPEYQQIAAAEKVEGRLSRTSFNFDERHRGALRALLRRMAADSTAP